MNLDTIEEKKSNLDLEFKNSEKKYIYFRSSTVAERIVVPLFLSCW
jgi:hypothetical protein